MSWFEPNREQMDAQASQEAQRILRKHKSDITAIRAAYEKHRTEHARLDDGKRCFAQDRMAAISQAYREAIELVEELQP